MVYPRGRLPRMFEIAVSTSPILQYKSARYSSSLRCVRPADLVKYRSQAQFRDGEDSMERRLCMAPANQRECRSASPTRNCACTARASLHTTLNFTGARKTISCGSDRCRRLRSDAVLRQCVCASQPTSSTGLPGACLRWTLFKRWSTPVLESGNGQVGVI